MRRALFLFIFALALPAGALHAASVSVETRALPSKAAIGDEIRLFVRVERPRTHSVEPPSDKIRLDPFEVKRVDVSPLETGKNRVVETFVVTLTVFEKGDLTVPSFGLTVTDASGRKSEVTAPPAAVKVTGVAGELTGKEDIKPIKGPVTLDLAALRTAALAAAAFLLTVLLAAKVWRRRRRRAPVDPESLLPPHERAMRELARLDAKGWLDAGEPRLHYAELGDILRRYIERRFGVNASDLTTAETLRALKEKELPPSVSERVAETLKTADLAKFAKEVPSRSSGEKARTALVEAVESTRPVEEAKTEKKR